jgi:hypothetical protein
MSPTDTSDEQQQSLLRTGRPLDGFRPNAEMNAIGWTILLGLLIILLPLLPFIAIVYLFSRLFSRADPRTGSE